MSLILNRKIYCAEIKFGLDFGNIICSISPLFFTLLFCQNVRKMYIYKLPLRNIFALVNLQIFNSVYACVCKSVCVCLWC